VSWTHEFKLALKTREEISTFFECDFPEVNYPIFIPIVFAAKILAAGPNSPLWNQFLPHPEENNTDVGRLDPIGDKVHAKNNQLIHRYENRVLFTPTTVCPVLCRYCFRKNELADKDDIFDHKFIEARAYLKNNPEVNEVIFTGGDPFILSNEKIAYYLQEFSEINSIKYIRFHTRTPIILPSRIDEGLIAILGSAKHLFKRSMVMIHVNHESELTEDVLSAIHLLTEANIEVFSQSVLLKGVNDSTNALYDLFTKLADNKVLPYYLHHPDEARGAMYFYLSLEEGRRIFAPLHNKLPGWALPQYIVDIPGGHGKIPAFNPENFEFSGKLITRLGEKVNIR
jgi:lysine 2,3-aminomutase